MEIVPLGDSALVVRVRERFDDAPEETLDEVLRAFQRIRNAAIPGVIELAPAYTSVAVFFDPVTVAKTTETPHKLFDSVVECIRAAVVGDADIEPDARSSRTFEIPVCYDPEFGPDLNHVAEHTRMSPTEVVDFHTTGEYRVACIGFVPGFPFLTGLPTKLATPRRDVPRKEIPPGAVGIGGAQTGIYPLRSPGGWNLIGRTPLRLFDPDTNPPTVLRAGDCVRFRAVTRDEFAAFGQATAAKASLG